MFSKSTRILNSFTIYYFIIATCYSMVFELLHIPSYTVALILLIANVFFVNPSIIKQKFFYWMFINSFVLILYFFSGRYLCQFTLSHELTNTLNIFFNAAILFEWILYTQDMSQIKRIVEFFTVIIIIKITLAINLEIQNPGINRDLVSFGSSEKSYGIMNFGTIFALPIIASSMLFLGKFRENIKAKLFYIIFSISVVIGSAVASRVTGLLFTLFLVSVVLFMNVKNQSLNKVLYPIVSVFLLITIFQTQLLDVLEQSSIKIIHLKAIDMKESLVDKEATGDVFERTSRYEKSFNAFIDNPIFGSDNSKNVLGGHSFWLDHLGGLGIIGTIPVILTLFFMYMRVIQILPVKFRTIYLLLYVTNMVILFFNPFADDDTFVWLVVFIPFSFIVADSKENGQLQNIVS